MTWVVEEPLYIVILGVVTLAFLGFAWMQTGYRSLLHAAIGAAALTVGLLLLEYMVDTESERIEATLHRIARDVERNDHDAIYAHVYSGAPNTRARPSRSFPGIPSSASTSSAMWKSSWTSGEPARRPCHLQRPGGRYRTWLRASTTTCRDSSK